MKTKPHMGMLFQGRIHNTTKFRQHRSSHLNAKPGSLEVGESLGLERWHAAFSPSASAVPGSSPLTSLKLDSENPSLRSIRVPSDLHLGRPLELAARMR